ncbi:hypothetical protein niasHS_005164 [Heterodera schachtii]|uniref:Secreted protein n=1 Tax=Heterodera schachtii TaxID=97005 RepID=A0ABD2JRM0_HETSC
MNLFCLPCIRAFEAALQRPIAATLSLTQQTAAKKTSTTCQNSSIAKTDLKVHKHKMFIKNPKQNRTLLIANVAYVSQTNTPKNNRIPTR